MSGTSQWCGGSTLLQRPDATTAIRPSATMVSTNLSVSPKQKWWLQSAKWLLYKNCIIILLWRENCFGPDEKREILANKSVIGWPNNLTCPACPGLPSVQTSFSYLKVSRNFRKGSVGTFSRWQVVLCVSFEDQRSVLWVHRRSLLQYRGYMRMISSTFELTMYVSLNICMWCLLFDIAVIFWCYCK